MGSAGAAEVPLHPWHAVPGVSTLFQALGSQALSVALAVGTRTGEPEPEPHLWPQPTCPMETHMQPRRVSQSEVHAR